MLSILVTGALYVQPVKTHGQLRVEDTQLVNSKGSPVVLRGMSFGWKKKDLKAAGVKTRELIKFYNAQVQ